MEIVLTYKEGNTLSVYCQSGGTGSLTARSSHNTAAGIGAARYGSGGNINIYGGIICAYGGKEGAGIGGIASCSHGGTVKIYGGNGADVYIYGGSVTATGGGSAPSIGAGGSSGIHGSFQTGENGNAVIFANVIKDQSKKSQWSGVIFEGNYGTVYKDQTLTQNLTVDSGKTLNIPENTKFTVPEGVNLTNNDTIIDNGMIVSNGIITRRPEKTPIPMIVQRANLWFTKKQSLGLLRLQPLPQW